MTARNQYRHYRTLIALVLAMSAGTTILFWLARFSPVTPLRSTAAGSRQWTQISVRAETDDASRGFFHYRIDDGGRLYQSYAWKAGQDERSSPRTIHILLTCLHADAKVTERQAKTLSKVISQLRDEFEIPADRVYVEAARGVAEKGEADRSRLRRT